MFSQAQLLLLPPNWISEAISRANDAHHTVIKLPSSAPVSGSRWSLASQSITRLSPPGQGGNCNHSQGKPAKGELEMERPHPQRPAATPRSSLGVYKPGQLPHPFVSGPELIRPCSASPRHCEPAPGEAGAHFWPALHLGRVMGSPLQDRVGPLSRMKPQKPFKKLLAPSGASVSKAEAY